MATSPQWHAGFGKWRTTSKEGPLSAMSFTMKKMATWWWCTVMSSHPREEKRDLIQEVEYIVKSVKLVGKPSP
ncbi:MAG: hypothetical protein KatS3mg029_0041 [Saprospiraceae bacterium]|nr:MAG: hypothetical protein KatS3mg029_0041 [Saprospiraceae bacterium]